MEDYLKKLTSFLSLRRPIEIETLTIEDDESPVGTEAYEAPSAPELKDGQDLTVHTAKVIGGPTAPKTPPVYIKPNEVIDNRKDDDEVDTVMIWNKAKGCYVKRKRT